MLEQDELKEIQKRITDWKDQGGELDPRLIEFVDDIYVLASKMYMIVHRGEDN